jgi:hypothetical protein
MRQVKISEASEVVNVANGKHSWRVVEVFEISDTTEKGVTIINNRDDSAYKIRCTSESQLLKEGYRGFAK